VARVEDVVKPGDKITVKVIEVDELGRINLSCQLDKLSDERRLGPNRPRRR
jgi:predicted RNA-binding protein with RPS1 domain